MSVGLVAVLTTGLVAGLAGYVWFLAAVALTAVALLRRLCPSVRGRCGTVPPRASATPPVIETSECDVTGALLRRTFVQAGEARARAARSDRPLAFLALDMDHLKVLNDNFGHEVGDEALLRLVRTIRQCAGPDATVGRLGGDEFAVMMDCPSAENALRAARRILAMLAVPAPVGPYRISLSATIGIAMLPEHADDLEQALRVSDIALYAGKNAGRQTVTLFDPAMLHELRRAQEIEKELQVALENGELRQLYLPSVDGSGRITSMRSVLRWKSGTMGPVPYEAIVKVAERTHLIDRIGEWSLRRACQDSFLFDEKLSIGVAVTAGQMRRDRIVDSMRAVLSETGVDPKRIAVVLAATDGWARDPHVERRMRQLHGLGIRVAVEDVDAILCGTEPEDRLPISIFRVGASRVARLGMSDADDAIVASLVRIAKALDILVVADGVASRNQFELAQRAGCDRFSGSLFSLPMDVGGINRRIVADRRRFRETE